MNNVLLVMVGGALGTLARYGLMRFTYWLFGDTFFSGTLTVNLIGSLLIGLLCGLWSANPLSAGIKTFVLMGLLGGFTTFSTYAFETFSLFKEGELNIALINILVHNMLGLLLVFIGFMGGQGLANMGK